MTLFVDASAYIALLAREEEAVTFAALLQADAIRLSSALGIWETVSGLCRSYRWSVRDAREQVALYARELHIRIVPTGEGELMLALDAYARYGKGRHPAALNMGDCFAYACAKANGARRLFNGDDFGMTDIEAALPAAPR